MKEGRRFDRPQRVELTSLTVRWPADVWNLFSCGFSDVFVVPRDVKGHVSILKRDDVAWVTCDLGLKVLGSLDSREIKITLRSVGFHEEFSPNGEPSDDVLTRAVIHLARSLRSKVEGRRVVVEQGSAVWRQSAFLNIAWRRWDRLRFFVAALFRIPFDCRRLPGTVTIEGTASIFAGGLPCKVLADEALLQRVTSARRSAWERGRDDAKRGIMPPYLFQYHTGEARSVADYMQGWMAGVDERGKG